MGRIKILASDVAGKIAAGEVVERPASAVKELVENSMDAGATRILIAIEDGGKQMIRVEDDGCGMSRDDALLSFERHATSKLRTAADLLRVSTRGFRGEALPSIAEVSRLQLWSNDLVEECGTYVRISGGVKEKVEDIALPRGTIVQVDDLFYNFPAREKFLKTAGGETGHITRTVEMAALSSPIVFFALRSGGRKVLQWEAVETPAARIGQVLGKHVELLEFDESNGPFHWHGFIAPPLERSVEKPFQHFFVNGRPVKDRTLGFALRRAYQEYLQRDTNPSAVIYLEVDPGMVDVNVHPAKTEIKFLESNDAFRSLHAATKRRLGKMQTFVAVHLSEPGQGAEDPIAGKAALPPLPARPLHTQEQSHCSAPQAVPSQMQLDAPTSLRDSPFTVLGQYMESFIVVSTRDGILVIDQHNAHERALYEDYCAHTSVPSIQKFLIPLIMDLSDEAFNAIMENAPSLSTHGLHIEAAGPRSIAIREAPAQLGEAGAIAFLAELVHSAETAGDLRAFLDFHLLRSMACHSAIKINMPLTPEKMESIIRNLFATSTPMVCPHGRPIIVKLRLDEILRGLRRNTQGFSS